jgi:hypothetical protein
VEETAYWFNLLIDSTLPICGNAAQRPQGQASNDGPKNIIDSVDYITSRVWADEQGRNRAGAVVIQEQQVFAAREVAKVDARPGGYIATGGHGGILGGVGGHGAPVLLYLPATRHTYKSDVNVNKLPASVKAVRATVNGLESITLAIKGNDGMLLDDAIPSVSIVKDGGYGTEDFSGDPSRELDLIALINHKMSLGRLAGFIIEGLVPYGTMPSSVRQKLMLDAVFSGLPVVRVGRGYPQGFADPHPHFIPGSNLTSTKARMLLMACLMKFGSLPLAKDPANPTAAEKAATAKAVSAYQEVFATH